MLSYFYYFSLGILFVFASAISFVNLAPQFGSNPSSKQKKQYEKFFNYESGSFKPLEQTPLMTGEISTWDFFKSDSMRKPKNDIKPNMINYDSFRKNSGEDYKISWLGHSAFLLNISENIILLDPMLGSHAAPLPVPNLKRFNDTLPIDPDSILNIDVVLISHDHYDHLDYSTIKRIRENVSRFIVPFGVGNHLRKWNVEDKKIIELNWNDTYKKGDIEFTCLPARHFSGRGPLNRNSTLWSSWAIRSTSLKIYFSGDSGYGKHLKTIGEEYGPFDIALIDCGQYNNAWKHSHMFPPEAVQAAKDVKTDYFMPIHWAGFTLAMHPWDEPVKESIKHADIQGLKYFTPKIGEVISNNNINGFTQRWWESY